MKIITIASKESGVGKSAVAVHLAHHLRDIGKSVLVMDLAYTGNTSNTLAEFAGSITVPELFDGKVEAPRRKRMSPGIGLIRSDLAEDAARWRRGEFGGRVESTLDPLRAGLAAFAPHFDYCVVDTAPGLCARARAALLVADMVLVPVIPAVGVVAQVDRIFVDLAVLNLETRTNPGPTLLLPSRFRSARSDARAAQAQLSKCFQHPTVETPIGESEEIQAALTRRLPVWALGTRSSRRPAMQMRAALEAIEARLSAC